MSDTITYSQENYDKLKEAIATGAKMVMYGNKQIIYQDTEQMQALLVKMARSLGILKPNNGRSFAEFSKD